MSCGAPEPAVTCHFYCAHSVCNMHCVMLEELPVRTHSRTRTCMHAGLGLGVADLGLAPA
eukprot:SAG11_NODE_25970_length_351_cov_1.015873_2_plen_60_part_01